jgi:hypothetical protein
VQDTATATYYAQLVQVHAALRSAGVTAIQMVSMNFGQSTVQGSSAQVATTESWQATYADGTTTDDTRAAAELLRFDGAYLRFSGEIRIEHLRGDEIVDRYVTEDAIWELMYFGHARV